MTTEILLRDHTRTAEASLAAEMAEIGRRARAAAASLALASADDKSAALRAAAQAVRAREKNILAANARDLAEAEGGGARARRCATGWRSTRNGSRRSPPGSK